jgi:hypothetical protein
VAPEELAEGHAPVTAHVARHELAVGQLADIGSIEECGVTDGITPTREGPAGALVSRHHESTGLSR